MSKDSFAFVEAMIVYGLENPMASGMTTVVFDKGEEVECVCVDYVKTKIFVFCFRS